MSVRLVPNTEWRSTNATVALQNTTDVTVGIWAKLLSLPSATAGLIGLANSTWNGFDYDLRVSTAGVPDYYMYDGAAQSAVGPPMRIGSWHYICGVRQGTNLMIYFDGKLWQNTTIGTPATSTERYVYIGRYNLTPAYSNVELAHGFVHYTALDAATVNALSQGALPPEVIKDPVNLQGYWEFNASRRIGACHPFGRTAGDMQVSGTWAPAEMPSQVLKSLAIVGGGDAGLASYGLDNATVLVDIQASASEVVAVTETATVSIDLQVVSVEAAQFADATTVLVDLQVTSFECHIKWQPTFTGVMSEKWDGAFTQKWTATAAAKWSATMSIGTVLNEC